MQAWKFRAVGVWTRPTLFRHILNFWNFKCFMARTYDIWTSIDDEPLRSGHRPSMISPVGPVGVDEQRAPSACHFFFSSSPSLDWNSIPSAASPIYHHTDSTPTAYRQHTVGIPSAYRRHPISGLSAEQQHTAQRQCRARHRRQLLDRKHQSWGVRGTHGPKQIVVGLSPALRNPSGHGWCSPGRALRVCSLGWHERYWGALGGIGVCRD